MTNWNSNCYYTLICFATPLQLNTSVGSELCKFYGSDNPDRKSLIIDISNYDTEMGDGVSDCLKHGPFNTLLLTNTARKDEELRSFRLPSEHIDMDHLILFSVPFSSYHDHDESERQNNVTSLTVIKSDLILSSTGLRSYNFKHIRLEECLLKLQYYVRLDELLFSDSLETLVLISGRAADPWYDFNYDLAPNLEELRINGFRIQSLQLKKNSKFPSLERLDLSGNQIRIVGSDCFDNMPKLKEINLENNELYRFHVPAVERLKRVRLDGNPFFGDTETCHLLRKPQVFVHNMNALCDTSDGIIATGTKAKTYNKKKEL